jgi:hypothetical protein
VLVVDDEELVNQGTTKIRMKMTATMPPRTRIVERFLSGGFSRTGALTVGKSAADRSEPQNLHLIAAALIVSAQ